MNLLVTFHVAGSEALMVFASKTTIRAYYLESNRYVTIADDLQHVVGVSVDSTCIHWSDIQLGDEAIFRKFDNSSTREAIVTAGMLKFALMKFHSFRPLRIS